MGANLIAGLKDRSMPAREAMSFRVTVPVCRAAATYAGRLNKCRLPICTAYTALELLTGYWMMQAMYRGCPPC